ncbi:MAG TPA: amidohydrolase family protein [Candidatus Cloacimonadota bacterium]|nr:amidohydrolase family protein [Candidatus Cloacimonadota bacterium]
MKRCDLILDNALIVTLDEQERILSGHAVVIKDNKIVDILKSEHAKSVYEAQEIYDLKDKLLLPGFINMHTHIPMSYFKGLADDLPLQTWLEKYIWPNEAKHISKDFIYDASLHGIAELIKNGITQFNDMYFIAEQTAKACINSGMRATIGDTGIDFPMGDFHLPERSFEHLHGLRHEFSEHETINFSLAPHAIYTCSKKTLEKCRDIAQEEKALINIHLSETEFEVDQCIKEHGMRPVEYLDKIGLLSDRLIIAHGVHINEKEMELLKRHNVSVCINTKSNLKLASGFSPIKKYLEYGINLCMGTDSVASNNNLSFFDEMSITAKLHKALNQDPTILPAKEMLKMATINGAKALGAKDKFGSIEIGKIADLITLDTASIECQPFYDPYSLIVYTMGNSAVSDVMINGKFVLKAKQLLTINELEIIVKAKEYKSKLEVLNGSF